MLKDMIGLHKTSYSIRIIATEGGVLVGKNTPADLKDKTLIFETIERRMP